MLIDDIDFADLYLQQLRLYIAQKNADHWDQRAEKWRGIAPRLRTATCNN